MDTQQQEIPDPDTWYPGSCDPAEDEARERRRHERMQRLLDSDKRITTGAKLFTERAFAEATAIAQSTRAQTDQTAPEQLYQQAVNKYGIGSQLSTNQVPSTP